MQNRKGSTQAYPKRFLAKKCPAEVHAAAAHGGDGQKHTTGNHQTILAETAAWYGTLFSSGRIDEHDQYFVRDRLYESLWNGS